MPKIVQPVAVSYSLKVQRANGVYEPAISKNIVQWSSTCITFLPFTSWTKSMINARHCVQHKHRSTIYSATYNTIRTSVWRRHYHTKHYCNNSQNRTDNVWSHVKNFFAFCVSWQNSIFQFCSGHPLPPCLDVRDTPFRPRSWTLGTLLFVHVLGRLGVSPMSKVSFRLLFCLLRQASSVLIYCSCCLAFLVLLCLSLAPIFLSLRLNLL